MVDATCCVFTVGAPGGSFFCFLIGSEGLAFFVTSRIRRVTSLVLAKQSKSFLYSVVLRRSYRFLLEDKFLRI